MSDTAPFFSVVIPVYNSERYLNECLESVFSQTFKDFELILVDDASKDQSGTICDSWHNRHPDRVRVIHQANTGVYIAKRNGIKASRGRYIYVMDNDDLITSDRAFETLEREIVEKHCDVVIFNATDNPETGHLIANIPFNDRVIFEGEKLGRIYDEYLGTKNLHHIWMMVFRRELFDWDFEYSQDFRMLRDGPMLILPILSNASAVLYLKDTFYYWRIQNQNSASKRYDVVSFYRGVRFLHQCVIEYAQKWKYRSDRTNSLLKSSYIADITIAAIKSRSISPSVGMSRREYLRMLSDDSMFRAEYTLKNLEPYRKLIAFSLYHRQYWLINAMFIWKN